MAVADMTFWRLYVLLITNKIQQFKVNMDVPRLIVTTKIARHKYVTFIR